MSTVRKFIAFSCTHCPLEDPAAIDWLLGKIEEHQPDTIVHLGDGLEADSASRWPSEADWTLEDEFEHFDSLLYRVRTAAGKGARCVFLEGNHDANLLSINRIDKRLRGMCDWRKSKNLPEMQHWLTPTKYEYNRRGVWRLGQVVFSHGYEAGAGAGRVESCTLGNEYGLYIHGHTHRPHDVRQVMLTQAVALRTWYANAGTMGQMDREYMSRKRQSMWGQACIVGEAADIKSPRMSRAWDAHMELFRMYGEEE